MRVSNTTLISAVLACTVFFTTNAFADGDEKVANEKFQLDTITCWEVITLPEKDTAFALLLIYGYNAGLSGQAAQSGSMIEKTITAAGKTCGENPDMPALDAF